MDQQLIEIREKQKESWNRFSPGWKKWDDFTKEFLKPMGDEIIRLIDPGGRDMVLDVGAVVLVGLEGIRFLNACESDGITIANASPYISEWMALERCTGSNG